MHKDKSHPNKWETVGSDAKEDAKSHDGQIRTLHLLVGCRHSAGRTTMHDIVETVAPVTEHNRAKIATVLELRMNQLWKLDIQVPATHWKHLLDNFEDVSTSKGRVPVRIKQASP